VREDHRDHLCDDAVVAFDLARREALGDFVELIPEIAKASADQIEY
jgi:hypothetical protein